VCVVGGGLLLEPINNRPQSEPPTNRTMTDIIIVIPRRLRPQQSRMSRIVVFRRCSNDTDQWLHSSDMSRIAGPLISVPIRYCNSGHSGIIRVHRLSYDRRLVIVKHPSALGRISWSRGGFDDFNGGFGHGLIDRGRVGVDSEMTRVDRSFPIHGGSLTRVGSVNTGARGVERWKQGAR